MFQGKKIIIGVHAGGLGDHLAYSALPRLYKRSGASSVLLSSITNFGEPCTRNPEVLDLVWKRNPFLDGFSDQPANVGERGWPPTAFFSAAKHTICPIDTVAKIHGLSVFEHDMARILPPKPDIFYTPNPTPEFFGKIVCDPRSFSQEFSPAIFERFTKFIAQWHEFSINDVIVLESQHAGHRGSDILSGCQKINVKNIYQYIDIITSAKYCLFAESGGQALAAAFRNTGTFVLWTTRAFNERLFMWPNNYYCVTGQMTPNEQEWP